MLQNAECVVEPMTWELFAVHGGDGSVLRPLPKHHLKLRQGLNGSLCKALHSPVLKVCHKAMKEQTMRVMKRIAAVANALNVALDRIPDCFHLVF